MNLDDEDITGGGLTVKMDTYYSSYGWNLVPFTPTEQPFSKSVLQSIYNLNKPVNGLDRIIFSMGDASKLFSKGSQVSISISNIINYIGVSGVGEFNINPSSISNVYIRTYDIEGNTNYFLADDFSVSGGNSGYYNVTLTVNEMPTDVYQIWIDLGFSISSAYGNGYNYFVGTDAYSISRCGGFYNSVFDFEETPQDKTDGLLGSIIQIVTNIKDGIVNLPSKIASSIKAFFDNIVNAITNMVTALKDKLSEVITSITTKLQSVLDGIKTALTTLGNFLIDGIKSLFVPTEDDITSMKDDWENLLATRFGALYEVVQLCIDYANSFNSAASVSMVSGSGSTITIPVVSIPLGDVSFDFGGWEVDVVPKGFEFLVDSIKLMFSVCATVLFVNGLRNKFDREVSK